MGIEEKASKEKRRYLETELQKIMIGNFKRASLLQASGAVCLCCYREKEKIISQKGSNFVAAGISMRRLVVLFSV